MTSIYKSDLDIPRTCRAPKMKFIDQGFQKSEPEQTDATEGITTQSLVVKY